MKKVNFRGLEVPLYPRVVNHGIDSFYRTAEAIDALDSRHKEWEKIKVLVEDDNYLKFISSLSNIGQRTIIGYLKDFKEDLKFKEQFSDKLEELETSGLKHVDDLRFHSLTIYCLVRALKPQLMVETGVAYGKSSAMALLAMHHNQKGKLISIDLPNPEGKFLEDGAQTSTGTREVGWLVPDFLKLRWNLRLGDARQLLPAEKAFWVIGGDKKGVMTKTPKWAFARKSAAEAFIKKSGGRLATYKEALALAEKD